VVRTIITVGIAMYRYLSIIEQKETMRMDVNLETGKRMRIGVFVSDLEEKYIKSLLEGIETAAIEIDADLVIMPGRSLVPMTVRYDSMADNFSGIYANSNVYAYQHNVIYNYAAENNFDAIMVDIRTVALGMDDPPRMKSFLAQFKDTPVITIGGKVEGYPYICFDNGNGLYEGISRLITQHGCKKIGLVAGPPDNMDARERLFSYREALMDYGIAYDVGRIAYGNFCDNCEGLIEELLDHNPDLEAIVFSNDWMAVSGYRVLKRRKIEIGSEMFVMGFDDIPMAIKMEPPLSTVRADAVKLGYEAVKQCMDLVNGLKPNLVIETEFIARESTGDTKNEYTGLDEEVAMMPAEELKKVAWEEITHILFEGWFDKEVIENHSRYIRDCLDYSFAMVYEKPSNIIMYDVLEKKLDAWMRLEDNISARRRVRVLEYLYSIMVKSLPDDGSCFDFAAMIRSVYRDAYILKDKMSGEERIRAERINYILTVLTRDMLDYTDGDERSYESMIDKIDSLYLKELYLYVYPEVYSYKEKSDLRLPAHMNLRLYKNEEEKGMPERDKQSIGRNELFDNPYVKCSSRHTLVATVLFTAKEQYGVFVVNTAAQNYKFLRSISRQFSSAVKTIHLLRQNAKLTDTLENNLRQIKSNNRVLNEMSKRDELTGIYNRRGFISAVEEELNDPMNCDKKAIVIYADMNNLKVINDEFGHEEGDFALRLVASMLKESFRSADIVGRFGGDEFAAFALVNQDNYIQKLRERITKITEKMNAETDKPYYVSMSVGICEFLCNDGVSLADIMDTADGDLYSQKKRKRTEVMK